MSKCLSKDMGRWRVIELNRPQKLNVLDEELVDQFLEFLKEGIGNPGIEGFVVTGSGDKGFCAGGDVVSVIEGQKNGRPNDFFFKKEYELDLLLNQCPKPVITLAHGITMGGGMGLLMGGSLKLIEKHTIFAMPEITIGFFPDVGASFFMNSLPRELKLFLTMSGARFSAENALDWGLVDSITSRKDFFDILEKNPTFAEIQNSFNNSREKHPNPFLFEIKQYLNFDSLESFDESFKKIKETKTVSDPLLEAYGVYEGGSPFSKVLTWNYFDGTEGISLEKSFKMDIIMAQLIAEKGDFHEGVRALLIEKDKNPKWIDESVSAASIRAQEFIKNAMSKI
ncbi:MAG: enoyl-CoA hydratase/isomerase family protein [Halobacteriovoraceae bacterium]|nr:enoyl-CoA hydratase/isomerase family protein [Halobacteriovoraceae bacterium]